jgi:glycosyl transferase family 25
MNIQNIPTIYINLEKRVDRNIHVINELQKIGFNNITRFNAIEKDNGALGCSFSHVKCLEIAIKNDYDYVFICEDDILFLDKELFLTNVNTFLNSKLNWDVVLIAGNNMLPYKPINDYCIQIFNCLTTTGYIVNKNYYNKLLSNYKEGILHMIKNPNEKTKYAIDKYWLKLQQHDSWYLIIPPSIIQKTDYSDIEGKVTNFTKYMLDYKKVVRI